MKFNIIILFFFFSINTIAQTSVDSSTIYVKQKKYDKALKFASESANIYSLINIGIDLFNSKDFENAIPFFIKSKEIGAYVIKPIEYLTVINMLGISYQELQDFENAEKYYLEAYKLNSKINGEIDKTNMQCLINIIAVNKLNDNLKKSQEYYLKLLKLQESAYGIDHPEYVNTLFNIGYNLCNLDLINEAQSYFLKAFELNDNINNNNLNRDLDFEIFEDNFNKNRNSKSFELLKILYKVKKNRFLKVKTKATAEDYIHFLNFNIGGTYFLEGQFEEAEKYLSESVEISKNIYSVNSLEYVNSLCILAKCVCFLNQDKAINYFNQIIILFEKLNIVCNDDYIRSLDFISLGNLELSNYKNRLEIQFKVLELKKKCFGLNSKEYSKTLVNLAGIYTWLGDFKNSEKYYLNALKIHENILNNNSEDYFYNLLNLSGLYSDSGLYSKQLNALILANEVFHNLSKKEDFNTFSEYFLLDSWKRYYYNTQDFYNVKKNNFKKNRDTRQ